MILILIMKVSYYQDLLTIIKLIDGVFNTTNDTLPINHCSS